MAKMLYRVLLYLALMMLPEGVCRMEIIKPQDRGHEVSHDLGLRYDYVMTEMMYRVLLRLR